MDRKTRKRYFQSKGGGSTAKKGKRGRLEPGMKGFLVTCSNNDESKCVREAYNLLNEYLDRMGGDKSVDDGEKGKEERSDKVMDLDFLHREWYKRRCQWILHFPN